MDLWRVHYLGAEDAWKGVLMEKLDKGLESLHNIQTEEDCRTKAELEAIKLITEGRHKEAMVILDALDDKVMKDFLEE